MQQKRTMYAFPTLSLQEIVANAVEMGALVEEKHLLYPTAEVVWPLYEAMAQDALTLSREELQQPAFDSWCRLEYPEMHRDSVGCLVSFRTIRDLMAAACAGDFGLRDLMKPESARTVHFCSALINYAKFRKGKEDAVAEAQDESLPETRQELEDAAAATRREIAAAEAEREHELPAARAAEDENATLWQEIVALNKTQSSYQGDVRALKAELTGLGDAIAGQNYLLQQAKQELDDVRAQVVESPEKLERALEEARAALEGTRVATEDARKSVHRWQQKLRAYAKSEKTANKLLALSEEAKRLLAAQKQAAKEVKNLRARLRAEDDEDRQRNAKLAELTLIADNCRDLVDKAELRSQERLDEEERKLEAAREQFVVFRTKQEAGRATVAKKTAQVNFLVSQCADVVATKEEVVTKCEEEIAAVQAQVLAYYRSLLAVTRPIPQLAD